jgi:ATP-dependent DNA helicase RecQ
MHDPMPRARQALQHHFGYPEFRPAQAGVVRSILTGQDTLAILPTGAGKSVCFQVPAVVLGGLTVVVSPLISLMQDQVAAANARGIPAAALTSGLSEADERATWERIERDELRLLYLSPERLERTGPELRSRGIRPVRLAVDEAHCIAEWGHDFRPSYRRIGAARYRLGRPPVAALTGSATPAVRRDILRSLGLIEERTAVHLASFDRANLWFGVVRVRGRERLEALLRLLRGDDRMAIVYAPTRALTESIARAVSAAGHRAAPYHAGLDRARRAAILDAFLDDRLDLVVATCAFGMGIDKPSVRLVVHWTLPPTPESYYQEAGRAGRDGEFARCVLLYHSRDAALHRRQLEVTFPPIRTLEQVWADAGALARLPANVRESAERLRSELRPDLGPVDWTPVRERRRQAEARIAAVEAYAGCRGCRRRALVGYFGEQLERCSGCDRCRTVPSTRGLSAPVVRRLNRLRQALGGRAGPWGGCMLEPSVLLRLARYPPATPGALADVPGVGPAIAEQFGRLILCALERTPRAAPPAIEAPSEPASTSDPAAEALEQWRSAVAREMGVPAYVVLSDRALSALTTASAESDPRAVPAGPRFRAKFEAEVHRLLGRVRGAGSP